MKTLEWRTVDKIKWKRGQWDNEPDKKQWMDEDTQYPCLINRGPSGTLCGYVAVNDGHPAFKKDYNDVDVEVHWGLTYAGFCQNTPNNDHSIGICHLVEPGEKDRVWWLGFDCAHSGDYSPTYSTFGFDELFNSAIYRSVDYVETQIKSLAQQLKEIEKTGRLTRD